MSTGNNTWATVHFAAGKNRPLDEEEIQFVDAIEAANRQREEQERQQEQQALGAFQLVRALCS